MAPSACNAQPWKFVVITDRELALKVGKAAAGLGMNKFAKDAPVHILIVEESANITSLLGGKVKDKHFPLIDIGIAAAHITLAAESEGLGSCILGKYQRTAGTDFRPSANGSAGTEADAAEAETEAAEDEEK